MMTENDARARLLSARAELEAEDAATEAGRAPVELDQTSVGRLSRMDAIQGQAMAMAAQQRRRTELFRIEAALRRLDEGEYGFCATCGEPISPKRLDLDPATAVCIECAA